MNNFKQKIVDEAKKPSSEQLEKAKQKYIGNEVNKYRQLYDNPLYREYLENILGAIMLIQIKKFPKYLVDIDARIKSPESIKKKISTRLEEDGYGYSYDENGSITFNSRPLLDAFAMKIKSEGMPEMLYSPDPYINDLIQEKEKNRDFLREMQIFRGKLNCDAFSYRNSFNIMKEFNKDTKQFEDITVTRIEYYQKCQELLEKLKTFVNPSEKNVIKKYDNQLNYVQERLMALRALNEPDTEKTKIRLVDLENTNMNFNDLLDEFEDRYNSEVELYNCTMQFLSLFRDDEEFFKRLGVSIDYSSLEEKRAVTGYESNFIILNTLVGPIEVQIQTLGQHEYGAFGPAAHSKRADKERELPILPTDGTGNTPESIREIEEFANILAQSIPIYYHVTKDSKEPDRVIAQKYDDYQGAKAYYSQTDQSDSSKLMDNHEYFERFAELSKTDAFQKALINKGATLGFTPIDIKKYVESNRLEQLRTSVEKGKAEQEQDTQIEK